MPEQTVLKRIHIIGGPGSGKTTLARNLSRSLGIPYTHLDNVGCPAGAEPGWNLDDKLAAVATIAARESWITEGIYLWWTDDLLTHADVILWLDIPWRVAAWRIATRHLKASLRGSNRHRGLRRLLIFLRNAHGYYTGPPIAPRTRDDDNAVTRAATEDALLPAWSGKVVRIRDNGQLATWMASLHDTGNKKGRPAGRPLT